MMVPVKTSLTCRRFGGSTARATLSSKRTPALDDKDWDRRQGCYRVDPADVERCIDAEAQKGNASQIRTGCRLYSIRSQGSILRFLCGSAFEPRESWHDNERGNGDGHAEEARFGPNAFCQRCHCGDGHNSGESEKQESPPIATPAPW